MFKRKNTEATKQGSQMLLKNRRFASFRRQEKLKVECDKETVPGYHQDKEPLFGRPVQIKTVSSESTSPGSPGDHSGDNPKNNQREPGNKRGSFPDRTSSWSSCFSESVLSRNNDETCIDYFYHERKSMNICFQCNCFLFFNTFIGNNYFRQIRNVKCGVFGIPIDCV